MGWLVNDTSYYSNKFNYAFIFNALNGLTLVDKILDGAFGPRFTDLGDYLCNFTYFPIKASNFTFDKTVNIDSGNLTEGFVGEHTVEGITASTLYGDNSKYFYMGRYHYIPTDYTMFEPYSKMYIYLPFYGYVNVPIHMVANKVMYFGLKVDYITGNARYIIISSTDIVSSFINNRIDPSTFSNCRIVAEYDFMLGYTIPIGSNGTADFNRNMLLTAAKVATVAIGAGALISSGASSAVSSVAAYASTSAAKMGSSVGKSISHRMGITNSSVNRPTVDDISEAKSEIKHITSRAGSIFNSSRDAMNISSLTPHNNVSNNSCLSKSSSNKIHIVIEKLNLQPLTPQYSHIFGKPLGVARNLNGLGGYTLLSDFKIDENYQELISRFYGTIPNDEMYMLNELMVNGVYFPDASEISTLSLE